MIQNNSVCRESCETKEEGSNKEEESNKEEGTNPSIPAIIGSFVGAGM
jgi:hypothetical protein